MDSVYVNNTLPVDAAEIAHRRLRSKLIRKFKRRRAYEKRVKKGKQIRQQYSKAERPLGFVPPKEEYVPLVPETKLQVDTQGLPPIHPGAASSSESSDSSSSESEQEKESLLISVDQSSLLSGNSRKAIERPHHQLYKHHHIKRDCIPTVVPDFKDGWTLVYSGTDNYYACTNLIPDEILLAEPGITVPVAFMVQCSGAEYPREEFSLLSDPVVIWTKIPVIEGDSLDTGVESHSSNKSVQTHSTTSSALMAEVKTNRKITTNLKGFGDIVIERKHSYYLGTGVSNHYY